MPPNGDDSLYDEVKNVPAKRLKSAVEKVDGLSPEEADALERGGMLALRGTKRRIARWALWFGAGAAATVTLAIFGAIGWISVAYIAEEIKMGRTGGLVSALLTFAAGVLVTLAVEAVWHITTKGRSDA